MKKLLSASVAAAAMTAGFAAPASADVSANAGFVTDYIYRGSNLGDAGAYVGVDYEASGFYAGVWAIDDESSTEIDYYLGYGMEHGDFSWGVGATAYTYTSSSDQELEFGLNLYYMGFGTNIYLGTDNNDNTEDSDYLFYDLYWAGEVFGVTYGHFQQDEDKDKGIEDVNYNYLEVSAGGEVAGLDMAVSAGRRFSIKEVVVDGGPSTAGTSIGTDYIVLDVSKSFDF
jgi:uncharacterized protein (TIGR02001 family)